MQEEQEKLKTKVNKKINDAVEFRRSNRDKEYLVNMAHYEGLQWNLAENKNDSPFLLRSDINHLKNAVDLRLGSLYSESYYGELKPLSANDVDNINVLNNIYRNEWERLNADDKVEEAIKNGCIQDNGYTEVSFDTGAIFGGTGTRREGSIILRNLATTDVYLDPHADSIDDCEYLVVRSQKSKDWIKRHKPEWLSKLEELNIEPTTLNSSEYGNIYTGRDYGNSESNLYDITTLYEKNSEERKISLIDEENNKILDKNTGEDLEDTVVVTTIKIYYVISNEIVEINEDYPFDEFPIIPFQWEPIPQSPYGIPLLRGLTVPQKVANLVESAANNIAMHYTIPTWLVSDESGLDVNKVAKLSNALGMVWKVSGDVSKAIRQMDVPVLDEQLISIKESFVNNIQTYAGVSQTYIGNIGTAGSTAEGTNTAINRATIIDNAPIKQIEKYVEKLSRMIIKFMTRYYKNQHIYVRDSKKRKDGSYSFQDFFVDENMESINYDFTVSLASRSKSDKNRQYNLMKDLYTIQNQYKEQNRIINVSDLVKSAQLDNYDEMFKRFQDMSEEAFQEKADLIVQIMTIGQTMTPNGQPLITAEEMQQGIIDVLDDNGDLSTVESLFKTYEEYQTKVSELQNNLALQDQRNRINQVQQISKDTQQMMQQGQQDMQNQANENQNVEQALAAMGL